MTHEEFIHLIGFALNDVPEKSDIIAFIEGDGSSKPESVAELYHAGFAPKVLVTGEIRRASPRGKLRTDKAVSALVKAGVPLKHIIRETNSISSREQAVEILKLAKENSWKKMILCAPLYHKPRLYATFVRAINEIGPKVKLINHPIRGLSWFEDTAEGVRLALFKKELTKVKKYAAKGHVATFKEILTYQKWKEKN